MLQFSRSTLWMIRKKTQTIFFLVGNKGLRMRFALNGSCWNSCVSAHSPICLTFLRCCYSRRKLLLQMRRPKLLWFAAEQILVDKEKNQWRSLMRWKQKLYFFATVSSNTSAGETVRLCLLSSMEVEYYTVGLFYNSRIGALKKVSGIIKKENHKN